ncbi:hypothetical protein bthur0004_61840 [Bacillus thuringiensis serovar sotto str. T04001]|nr:hypothetical protein bthur0004_61840 [Bacillus thuringiensis serovar sotto str. T04001]
MIDPAIHFCPFFIECIRILLSFSTINSFSITNFKVLKSPLNDRYSIISLLFLGLASSTYLEIYLLSVLIPLLSKAKDFNKYEQRICLSPLNTAVTPLGEIPKVKANLFLLIPAKVKSFKRHCNNFFIFICPLFSEQRHVPFYHNSGKRVTTFKSCVILVVGLAVSVLPSALGKTL